jgi:predicted enzyme related to lactoylglutathione lyase
MSTRERSEPGTFCWVDLATTDPSDAKAFYGELFNWEAENMPAGKAGTYTMLHLGGDEVCALYELDSKQREQGIPPHWCSYVSVEDADATAARASWAARCSARRSTCSTPGGWRLFRTRRGQCSRPGSRGRTSARAGSTTPDI